MILQSFDNGWECELGNIRACHMLWLLCSHFQIWEILFYDRSFEFCRKWEGHSMFAPFTSGWQQTETEPLIVAKGEVCNSSSLILLVPFFLPW
jgi:hypothetical protein